MFSGCGKYSLENRIQFAQNLAEKNQLIKEDIQTSTFKIRTYHHLQKDAKILKIFIEGDGFAWVDRYTISNNPTPIEPVALKLAIQNHSQNKAYISRPCQYITTDICDDKYWSDKRFSHEVIKSVNEVVSNLKSKTQAKKIELVGFSGGAAVAILVASRRDDISKIKTIAGNLDHKLLHKLHKIAPMQGSLNAIDVVNKISHIPQIHYVGQDDKVVSKDIAYSFKNKAKNSDNIKVVVVPNTTHTKGWLEYFREKLR